jgi:acyl-CoA synthetase (NDP forming)
MTHATSEDGTQAASAVLERYAPLFTPRTVAVVGASSTGGGRQNTLIRRIRQLGYEGAIYPIHPTAAEIEGLPAYRSLADTPQPIDYAPIAIPAARIPALNAAAAGRVRYAHVVSSGFGETEEGEALQRKLLDAAGAGGVRLLGPNSLGIYTPRGRVTFTAVQSRAVGSIGVVSQSGGLGVDVVRRGGERGLAFSGVVTVGNCADLDCADLLEFYLADPQTRVIGLYIESGRGGRRLFEMLRAARALKPVVVLKGGRTREGGIAASSHTGALAGDFRVWNALSRQTGCVLVATLDEFIDALLAFQQLAPRAARPSERIVLFGNGGGTSVLAADCCAELGLSVLPFDAPTRAALAELELPAGVSIANPVDCPAGALEREEGRLAERILRAIYAHTRPDALVMHLNMTPFVGRARDGVLENLIDAVLRVQAEFPGQAHFLLVLRSDGEPLLEARKRDFRAQALERGIPVFDEVADAAHALSALRAYERFVHART